MPYSTCCGAYTDMDEVGICPDCYEHCSWEYEEDEEELEQDRKVLSEEYIEDIA